MITNLNKKTTVSKHAEVYSRWWQHTIGLMFSHPKTIIFKFKKEKKISLHMFFVFFPIDVIFLDKENVVVEMKENFRPWTTYHPQKPAKYIIETPAHTIQNSKTGIGDIISFK